MYTTLHFTTNYNISVNAWQKEPRSCMHTHIKDLGTCMKIKCSHNSSTIIGGMYVSNPQVGAHHAPCQS